MAIAAMRVLGAGGTVVHTCMSKRKAVPGGDIASEKEREVWKNGGKVLCASHAIQYIEYLRMHGRETSKYVWPNFTCVWSYAKG